MVRGSLIYVVSYKKIYCPDHPAAQADGRVYEHRLIMEKKLGRYLKEGEEVHHIDHNIKNNHPDNLMLFTNHSEHTRHEMIGNTRNSKVDMNNRVCSNCNSAVTYIRPDNNRPYWRKDDNGGWLCKSCHEKTSDKVRDYHKEYRTKNREKIVSYLRNYHKQRKDVTAKR